MLKSVKSFIEDKFENVIRSALTDPGSFILTFLTYISPLMILCAVLAWKLQKAIEREQQEERRRERISKKLEQKKKD